MLTLVDICLCVMGFLVFLVNKRIFRSAGTGAYIGVGILGDIFVGLLGSLGTFALDGL
jgi:hypothetical protein